MRSSFCRAACWQGKQNSEGNTRWYFQGILCGIGSKPPAKTYQGSASLGLRIRRPKDDGSHCIVHPKGCVYKMQPCLLKWHGNGRPALRAAALRAGLANLAFAPCRGGFHPSVSKADSSPTRGAFLHPMRGYTPQSAKPTAPLRGELLGAEEMRHSAFGVGGFGGSKPPPYGAAK